MSFRLQPTPPLLHPHANEMHQHCVKTYGSFAALDCSSRKYREGAAPSLFAPDMMIVGEGEVMHGSVQIAW